MIQGGDFSEGGKLSGCVGYTCYFKHTDFKEQKYIYWSSLCSMAKLNSVDISIFLYMFCYQK